MLAGWKLGRGLRPTWSMIDPQRGGGGRGGVQRVHHAAGVEDLRVRERRRQAGQGRQPLHVHPLLPLQPRDEDGRQRRLTACIAMFKLGSPLLHLVAMRVGLQF